jgi:hypothetical protein
VTSWNNKIKYNLGVSKYVDHFVVTHNFILENTVVAIADIRCIWIRKYAYHENTCSGLNSVLNGLNTLSNMSLCLLNVVLHWVLNLSLHMLATWQTSSPITINSSRWGVISKGKKNVTVLVFSEALHVCIRINPERWRKMVTRVGHEMILDLRGRQQSPGKNHLLVFRSRLFARRENWKVWFSFWMKWKSSGTFLETYKGD